MIVYIQVQLFKAVSIPCKSFSPGVDGGLGPIGNVQLAEYIVDMTLDRTLADEQLSRALLLKTLSGPLVAEPLSTGAGVRSAHASIDKRPHTR